MKTKRFLSVLILTICLVAFPALTGAWYVKRAGTSVAGDVNGDGVVDVADIASVISVMTKSSSDAAADVNKDGVVDVADIATIISVMAGSPAVGDESPIAPIELSGGHLYACSAGDTLFVSWTEVEDMVISTLSQNGIDLTKREFESIYSLRGMGDDELSLQELNYQWNIPIGQVYVPYTNKTSISGTRKNWVDGVDLGKASNWVLPHNAIDGNVINSEFADTDRYGSIIYTNYDWMHREKSHIGVAFTGEQMLQQLVKRDHEGVYLDSLGFKVNHLSEADFYPYVDTKVAAKLYDYKNSGQPDITVVFNVRIHLNMVTMNRPLRANNDGNWYSIDGVFGGNNVFLNANIDAFSNGSYGGYNYDVRRFVLNLQQNLKGQSWLSSIGSYQRAFDFFYNEITGNRAAERIGIQKAKLDWLHGDLYFYTKNWLGDIEEGTPYWHDKDNTNTIEDDKFYADKYLIKVCYTQNPLDTVVWNQVAGEKRQVGKLGKYLFAYIQKGSHFDMANGELIAWIDNCDTRQVAANSHMRKPYANYDLYGRLNENVNIHYNFNSKFAQDLLNRAGRYAENNSGTQDGYSKATDNPFSVNCHLNLFEGNCLPAVNPSTLEQYEDQKYIVRSGYGSSFHRPEGAPVRLQNPDFVVRFLRPLNVEFKTPWQNASINAVYDDVAGGAVVTITYKDLFRDQSGSPYSRIFPMDWRAYRVKDQTEWIQFYQGKQSDSKFNQNENDGETMWNQAPWKREVPNGLGYINGFKYMDKDRSSYDRGSNLKFYNWMYWYYMPNTSDTYADTWNSMNVVPQVDHMLTNYGGSEGFWSTSASQVNMQIIHTLDPATGNIVSTTFRYNDNFNNIQFDILIPVTVKYAWGDITTTGKWESTSNIQSTNESNFHNANMNYIKIHFESTIVN